MVTLPKHLETWRRVLADQIREARRLRPVVLQDDAAHPAFLREPSHFERVPLARITVRVMMDVKIDRPDQGGSVSFWSTDGATLRFLYGSPMRLRGWRLRAERANRPRIREANRDENRNHPGDTSSHSITSRHIQ
jgi:hypothetical protein